MGYAPSINKQEGNDTIGERAAIIVGQFWPHIWNKQPKLPWYVCVYCCLGGLWGHGSLQMTSASDLNYLCSHAFLACEYFPEMIQMNRANYDQLTLQCFARS